MRSCLLAVEKFFLTVLDSSMATKRNAEDNYLKSRVAGTSNCAGYTPCTLLNAGGTPISALLQVQRFCYFPHRDIPDCVLAMSVDYGYQANLLRY